MPCSLCLCSTVQDDLAFAKKIAAQSLYFKAFRYAYDHARPCACCLVHSTVSPATSTSFHSVALRLTVCSCVYIADSHKIGDKLREALALYDRAALNIRTAIAHFEQCDYDVKVRVQSSCLFS